MSDDSLLLRRLHRSITVVLGLSVVVLTACSGGGGGSGSTGFDNNAVLLSLRFPDPGEQNSEPDSQPPGNASLIQQVIFTFSGRPNPAEISTQSIEVRDGSGFLVAGSFQVDGQAVMFTPTLPTRPLVDLGSNTFDTGGTSFLPGQSYSFRLGPDTWRFIEGINSSLLSQFADPKAPGSIKFFVKTTTDPTKFFTGIQPIKPELVSSDPKDGVTGISPNLFTDPDAVFPPSRSYTLTFHEPINPATANLSAFRLVDLDELAEFPEGLPLSVNVELVTNELSGATVSVTPSGILPFGHMLALEFPSDLKGLAEGDSSGPLTAVACTFTVAEVPAEIETVHDAIVENFDTADRRGSNDDLVKGYVPASWDLQQSDLLQAAAAFQGFGELGRFIPPPPPTGQTSTVILDTGDQSFPLFDGSTPDAPVTTVRGGVFAFTDIDIPAGVIVLPQGPNPIVFLATGTVRIAGQIRVNGVNGVPESSYDSAITSTPGGPGGVGGGRGGVGHPIVFWPPDSLAALSMIDPVRGGRGFGAGNLGPVGGEGGETGILDHKPLGTNYELDSICQELTNDHGNGGRTPGGGGGSYLTKGNRDLTAAQYGIGNVRADGRGGYIIPANYEPDDLYWGTEGLSPFSDANQGNNYIGVTGELTEIVAGQGGGGGGTRLESYYCGWCKLDTDSVNDNLCLGGEFPLGDPLRQTFAASVGDGKGGGAGGGGGALWIRALGAITIDTTGVLNATGGTGGGGEVLGCGSWGGGAGGGSGGAILVESAENVIVKNGALIDVTGGTGALSVLNDKYHPPGCDSDKRDNVPGVGGDGGHGIIQLQVPFGRIATVENKNSIKPLSSWVDKENGNNPAAFTALSQAISTWYDVGRMIARDPVGASPSWKFRIAGNDVPDGNGEVLTDSLGYVVDPAQTDIVCDYLGQFDESSQQYEPGQEPHSDFIPTNARVYVQFQGAHAVVDGSKEVDSTSLTEWNSSPTIANGHQFIRYRISFDIAFGGAALSPDLALPVVQSTEISADY